MPRKLIINKITSVKAITDNKCVKEVLRCVWSRGRRQLNGRSALFSWDGPPKDKELGQTKTLLAWFYKLFFQFVFSLMLSNPTRRCRNKHPRRMKKHKIDSDISFNILIKATHFRKCVGWKDQQRGPQTKHTFILKLFSWVIWMQSERMNNSEKKLFFAENMQWNRTSWSLNAPASFHTNKLNTCLSKLPGWNIQSKVLLGVSNSYTCQTWCNRLLEHKLYQFDFMLALI